MDAKLSNVISQRISALFRGYKPPSNGSSENGISFENKNRSKELKRLAKSMEMDIPKLKGFLGAERRKTKNSSKMAQYIDWVAASSPEDQAGGSQKHKRSDDTGNATSLQESAKKARKNNEGVRPSRDGQEGGSSNHNGNAGKRGKGKGRQQNNQGGKDQSQRNHSQKDDAMQIDDSPAPSQGLATSAIVDKTLLSKTSFADLKDLHPATKRALSETMGLKFMTEIQDKTYAAASSGADVLGRARTGTGKTLAFLLPSLERIVTRKDLYKPGKNVGVLIISPTRELAMQIADQAQRLITFHSKDIKVQVMYGGTKMGKDTSFLNRRLPTVLVATPGRLLDHMENTELQNGRKFGSGVMSATPVVVLDEADRLLEMGFRREINKILAYLPTKENRQTLLFSATIPKELKQIMSENMRGDFVEVDCIQDRLQESGGQHTNAHVEQTHVILPSMDRYVASIVEIVQRAMQEDMKEHKVVVFFPTARVVGFFADFFNTGLKVEVIELHSRKSQTYRNKASEKFRNAKRGVLFTSDVSARGKFCQQFEYIMHYGHDILTRKLFLSVR